MPTYNYTHLDEKTTCHQGIVFEKIEKITSEPQTVCEVCGQGILRQISGGVGVIFKGSGFYATDYPKTSK